MHTKCFSATFEPTSKWKGTFFVLHKTPQMYSDKKRSKTKSIHFKASTSQFDYFFSFKAVHFVHCWECGFRLNRAAMGTKMRTKVVLDLGESLSARMHSKNRYRSPNTLRQGCNRPSEDSASQTLAVTSTGEFYFPVKVIFVLHVMTFSALQQQDFKCWLLILFWPKKPWKCSQIWSQFMISLWWFLKRYNNVRNF